MKHRDLSTSDTAYSPRYIGAIVVDANKLIVEKKWCGRCRSEKETSLFGNASVWCKECLRTYKKEYYIKNKKSLSEKAKRQYESNPEPTKARSKEYSKCNKEKQRLYGEEYRKKNSDKIKLQKKKYQLENPHVLIAYRAKNKDEISKKVKEYQNKNKRKLNEWDSAYKKKKYKSDINYRIKVNLRARIVRAMKNFKKSDFTMKLVGCNLGALRRHLESLFKQGMNWGNYGVLGWHIDHILPCCSFNLADPEQQKICFHYTNLQPLWAVDNLKKGGKIAT